MEPNKTIMEQIKKDVETHPVLLFMKGEVEAPMCRFSLDVVRTLGKYDIHVEGRNVLEDDDLRESIKVFSDWPTLPQLYVNGQFIGGRDIVLELDEEGELEPLLMEAK